MKIIWNLPNVLTIFRFILSPVFFLFLVYGHLKTALFFFLLVAISDFADGWFARATSQTTRFGEVVDPLADKFMIFLAVVGLAIKFGFPFWAIPLILVRDIVSLGGSFVYFSGIKMARWKVRFFGKATTFFQVLTVVFFILDLEFKLIVLYIAIGLSIISGAAYLFKGISALSRPF